MIDYTRILEDLSGRYARPYATNISELLVAKAMGNLEAMQDSLARLADVMRETMGVAEVMGSTLALQKAAEVVGKETGEAYFNKGQRVWAMSWHAPNRKMLRVFADTPTQTLIPRVTFKEALQDMVDRTPVTLRRAAERSAANIAKLYSEGTRIAFAKSAEEAVTNRVHQLIQQAMGGGIPELSYMADGTLHPGAGKQIADAVNAIRGETEAWSESYARMVFRTNVNSAVTAGRFRQAQDEDVKAVAPCFMFEDAGDVDVRKNHHAVNRKVFKVDNRVWNFIAPPLGYSCRCRVRQLGLPELRRMGRINPDGSIQEDRLPASAHPDPGFRHGGRPDLFLGGA